MGFVSITAANCFTTSTGRVLAGMQAVFTEFKGDGQRTGENRHFHARKKGAAALQADKVGKLHQQSRPKAEMKIASRVGMVELQ